MTNMAKYQTIVNTPMFTYENIFHSMSRLLTFETILLIINSCRQMKPYCTF